MKKSYDNKFKAKVKLAAMEALTKNMIDELVSSIKDTVKIVGKDMESELEEIDFEMED